MTAAFVTFEGIDGAGKSTHLDAVAAWFRGRGERVVSTREPGGTALAERLREHVLHEPMDALTEALLVFAARRDHVERVVAPALHDGAVVVCDRFSDATFAYQGHGRGVDLAVLAALERAVHGGLQPTLTLWFDLDPLEAARRRAAARDADRFEAEDVAFFERVRDGYRARELASAGRFARVDASCAPSAVAAAVEAILVERFATASARPASLP